MYYIQNSGVLFQPIYRQKMNGFALRRICKKIYISHLFVSPFNMRGDEVIFIPIIHFLRNHGHIFHILCYFLYFFNLYALWKIELFIWHINMWITRWISILSHTYHTYVLIFFLLFYNQIGWKTQKQTKNLNFRSK